ncbi:hypothetical protein ABFY60_00270 [Lysinibacillus pakistanensis]|uniref:hypothetical protein n=1 Tax=Lysinibacillus pakistanensis TaxID=759811 RepID=UPI003D2CD0E8
MGYHAWKDILKDLYQHAGGARFIDPLTEQDIKGLMHNAQELLAERNSKGRE